MNSAAYIKELEKRCEELEHTIINFESKYQLTIPSLEAGFNDRDIVLFHAAFTILSDFIELEWHLNPPYRDTKDAQDSDETKLYEKENREIKELMELYNWWKTEYPELEKKNMFDSYDLQNEKLMKLVSLRKFLWT
jgi:hypothetical protein